MPARLPAQVRALRLIGALGLLLAIAALAAILQGQPAATGRTLIAAAIAFGSTALLGMAAVALRHVSRKKEKNDDRS